jgi:hypothetical protein
MPSDRETVLGKRRELHAQMRALAFEPLMRGSIVERVRKCGRPNCACARDPSARHRGKYLSVHLDGRTQAVSLRQEDEERVGRAVAAYQRLWTLIDGLTECELSDLRREARERQRARSRRR